VPCPPRVIDKVVTTAREQPADSASHARVARRHQ
jgi:hypothetical protein